MVPRRDATLLNWRDSFYVPALLMVAGALGGALPAIRTGWTPVVKLIRAW